MAKDDFSEFDPRFWPAVGKIFRNVICGVHKHSSTKFSAIIAPGIDSLFSDFQNELF